MSKSENPLPPEEDPIVELLEMNLEDMSSEQLEKYVEKLHSVTNNPRELNRLLTGKQRKEKSKGKSARSVAEKAAFESLLSGL